MGPCSPKPVAQLKIEHREKGRQDRQEPRPDPDSPGQNQVRINFAQKGAIKKQVTIKIAHKKIINDRQLVGTTNSDEKKSQ
jgi:hypothetical protein